MVTALHRNDGRILAAVETIVLSPQFRMIRGRDFLDEPIHREDRGDKR
jgi:hypothetical protein